MRIKCTHVALQVNDMERSLAFYERYCGMRVVHDRHESFRVVWMGWGEQPPQFVIVLLETPYKTNQQPEFQHIGMAVESREDVDRLYERAVGDGIKKLWPPEDGGPIVGYFCAAADPDGNLIEFSHGQNIG